MSKGKKAKKSIDSPENTNDTSSSDGDTKAEKNTSKVLEMKNKFDMKMSAAIAMAKDFDTKDVQTLIDEVAKAVKFCDMSQILDGLDTDQHKELMNFNTEERHVEKIVAWIHGVAYSKENSYLDTAVQLVATIKELQKMAITITYLRSYQVRGKHISHGLFVKSVIASMEKKMSSRRVSEREGGGGLARFFRQG